MKANENYKVAAAHVAPIYHDTQKTVDKACSIIEEAARKGVQLIAFPETFIPGFPVWANVGAPIHTHRYFEALTQGAIRLDGPEIQQLRRAARKHGIIVSMGFNELASASSTCMWNANVLINNDGEIIGHRRKLVPTFFEKLVWANGDGAGLRVADTDVGRIGMLICGENSNPLARYSMIAQNEQLHISTYPPLAVMRPLSEAGGYDLEQAIRIRAAAHSFEGKVFNIVASGYYDTTMRKELEGMGDEVLELLDKSPKSVSMILGPDGNVIGDTLCDTEGLCIAEINYSPVAELRRLHDVAGYYNRFDIFRLEVNRVALEPIHFVEGQSTPSAGQEQFDSRLKSIQSFVESSEMESL
ncbi:MULTISPECIES: carbon-nitrogen hydrolase family protein [Pseudomonas]|uniref:Aliphatic nitrilase n=1 Tax=Pseudomonas putida TaxID=303 RepID=A0A2S3XCV3_PSEPU|nr:MULTISPECIES: carbon-nitrogen hydrolase family protein [Pseudomonas]AVD83829.1 aliphatic nitrilase [Pseudomonas sp. SWI6]AVD95002.1 aliphatic nitrilase [Pseudomonas sp. SWI36]ELU0814759.1 carbon-nitrogen hydrolase family protein [Pseudomonas putida]MBH3388226.1 carbon-nitrogen hydrolase family protein [Pseudomonas putida]MCK2121434.1 carbon-nitrogen hydrolase family protein [Pseudomonas sp. PNPG3]